MVIVRIQGGLGNQLFQYSLYESLKSRGIEAKVDISDYEQHREKRLYELPKLGLQPDVATQNELHQYYADNTQIFDKIMRYTIGRKKYRKEKCYDFEAEILDIQEGYLSGYWQSEQYFLPIALKLRKQISFQQIAVKEISRYQQEMEQCNSVSVHLRRGDYEKNQELYGGICTENYYKKAIQKVVAEIENPVFYLFSDDLEWADKFMKEYPHQLVTGNYGENSYKDMYLMSCCKNHIIANSTFSWWGAWLNPRENKMVVTPAKWNHLCKEHEICAANWTMIAED